MRNTGLRLSSIESIPLPTSLEELRDVSRQLADIAKSILDNQGQYDISTALEDLSAMIQSQIEKAVELNDRLYVVHLPMSLRESSDVTRSSHEGTEISEDDAASIQTARLSNYQWESPLIDMRNSSAGFPSRDEGLALSLHRLMQGPLAPPRRPLPSSIHTESIFGMDITPRPSPTLEHEELPPLHTRLSLLHSPSLDVTQRSELLKPGAIVESRAANDERMGERPFRDEASQQSTSSGRMRKKSKTSGGQRKNRSSAIVHWPNLNTGSNEHDKTLVECDVCVFLSYYRCLKVGADA